MKNLLALLLLLPLAGTAKADILFCTQRWCQEGLTVNLHGTEWPTGDYIFTVKADEKTVTCKGKLPFATCDGAVTCDASGVTILETGCALGQDQHAFSAVTLQDAAVGKIDITITRGDGKKADYSNPVEAECSFPNGEECDDRPCCSAVLDARVEWR